MGWGYCGLDKKGREIGYTIGATCDHEGCTKKIDRGLGFACGDMHGETEYGCEKYFCSDHRSNTVVDDESFIRVCDECAKSLIASGEWKHDDAEGCVVRVKSSVEKSYCQCDKGCGNWFQEVRPGTKCNECGEGTMQPQDVEPWE